MPFSYIIPPSPSPTESKRLFNTSVSLLLSHIQGYRYHLSKFHIYALVTLFFFYCCCFLTECSLQNIIELVKWIFGSKPSYFLLCYGVPFSYNTILHTVIRHYYNLYFPKKNNYYLNTILFSEWI